MRTFRSQTGPFREGIYYESDEIEAIASDELHGVGLFPPVPQPIRVERFISRRFGITPQYDDVPAEVLGFTRFGPKGAEEVVISRALSDEGSQASERRVSSTLAHEAGHVLLHGHLFAMQPLMNVQVMFKDEVEFGSQKILCKIDTLGVSAEPGSDSGYDGRWWEFQANMMIGALLLPRSLVISALGQLLSSSSRIGIVKLDVEKREEAVQYLAEAFDVNPVVARIRLGEIFSQADNQLTF